MHTLGRFIGAIFFWIFAHPFNTALTIVIGALVSYQLDPQATMVFLNNSLDLVLLVGVILFGWWIIWYKLIKPLFSWGGGKKKKK